MRLSALPIIVLSEKVQAHRGNKTLYNARRAGERHRIVTFGQTFGAFLKGFDRVAGAQAP